MGATLPFHAFTRNLSIFSRYTSTWHTKKNTNESSMHLQTISIAIVPRAVFLLFGLTYALYLEYPKCVDLIWNINLWEVPVTFLCGNVGSKTQMGDFHTRKRQTLLSIYHNLCLLETIWRTLSHQTCPITYVENSNALMPASKASPNKQRNPFIWESGHLDM